ncbi:MAG TPA: TRAP transporter small permease, partial [Calditrichaeota bacterium]|nr:TRAP transporter small permease [Calditrichota bacterium]
EKTDKIIAKIETWLLIVIVLVMVLFSFTQVLLRLLLDEGIMWADIFLRHLVLWVGFIGASLATRDNKHINIDLLNRYLKGKGDHVAAILINAFALFISFLLAKAGWRFVTDEREFGTMLFGNVPAWYFQLIIPIGFGLMSFRFFIHVLQGAFNLFHAEETTT